MANPSFFTLLLALVVAQVFLSTGPGPGANALQGMNLAPPVVRRAEHAERMLKKRRPQGAVATDVPINVGGGGGDVPTTSPTTTPTTTATPTTTPTTSTTRPTTSAPPPPTTSSVSTPSPTIVAPPTTTSKSSSTTSTTSQTSTAQTSTPTATSTTQSAVLSVLHTTDATGGTVYVTASATDAAQASASIPAAAQDQSASFLPKSVIIGLIVTGSCIAAGAAIWTIIRKWKFSPSRQFEDRLEPINWEPTQGSGLNHDPTVAALARAGSRNDTRPSSYVSDDHDGSVKNMSSVHPEPISVAPDFPPAHDFTAGAASTGGYVDMHRGPSPAPGQYGSAYGGQYGGQYETPNPYDGYGQRHY